MTTGKNKSELVQKLKTLQPFLTPIVIAVLGLMVNHTLKTREINTGYVQLAIAILRDAPKPETRALRQWAISIVDRYAPIRLSPEIEKELERNRIALIEHFDGEGFGIALRLVRERMEQSPEKSKRSMASPQTRTEGGVK